MNCRLLPPCSAVFLCTGSTGESIDSIKDYEEDFFQNSRLLRQVASDSLNLNLHEVDNFKVDSECLCNKGRHAEGPPGDHKKPESGCLWLLLEDGSGVCWAAGWCLQRYDCIIFISNACFNGVHGQGGVLSINCKGNRFYSSSSSDSPTSLYWLYSVHPATPFYSPAFQLQLV